MKSKMGLGCALVSMIHSNINMSLGVGPDEKTAEGKPLPFSGYESETRVEEGRDGEIIIIYRCTPPDSKRRWKSLSYAVKALT